MDPTTASTIVQSILQLPSFLVDLRTLLNKSPVKDQGAALLDQIRQRIGQYAELHRELKEWKIVHERLNEVLIALINNDDLNAFLVPGSHVPSPNWDTVKTKWGFFSGNYMARLFDGFRDLQKITSFKLELQQMNYQTGEVIPVTGIDFLDRAKQLNAQASSSIQRSRFDDSSEHLRNLKALLNDGMIAADGYIRRMAGDLADLSIQLSTELKAHP